MTKKCENCNSEMTTLNKFCSVECRNSWVSDLMIKKSKKIKKEFGNAYYSKKESSNGKKKIKK